MKNIKLALNKTSLKIKKASPEILFAVGVIGFVGTIALACKATLEVSKSVEETKEKAKEANENFENIEEPTKETIKKHKSDLTEIYGRGAVKVAKQYGPAFVVGIASIGCLYGSHHILNKRNAGLTAAYTALNKSYNNYKAKYTKVDENKEVPEVKKDTVNPENVDVDPNGYSEYARFFDELSTQYSKTPGYNQTFLKCQQSYANDRLHARGHLFLNEVYESLGIPHSSAGAVVGWVLDDSGNSDGYVDFGILDICGDWAPRNSEFVNGVEKSVLLDFNVDGLIYDLI